MTLLWFIIALVFFLLWVNANSAQKQSGTDKYVKGFRDGKKNLADTIHAELEKKPSSHTEIKKIIDAERLGYQSQETFNAVENAPVEVYENVDRSEIASDGPVSQSTNSNIATESVSTPEIIYSDKVEPVRTKQQDVERNLNVLLYMASFLIVAAAAAFIATNMPPAARLVGLWLVIIAFYSAGLILHYAVPYLRPAATAFLGTGLALIPFAGIALSQLGGLSGGWAWFITSVIGIVSYLVAALRLQSQIVTYLTIAFTLSLAASSVATVSGPMVYYFVVLIMASLVFHLLAHFNPGWVPNLFKVPITQTSQLLTPLTLVASLLAYDAMTLASYQVVFWVATIYYLVLWLTEREFIYETVVRLLVPISVLISVTYFSDYSVTALLIGFLVLATLQALYSLLRIKLDHQKSRYVEITWLVITTALLIFSLPGWINTEMTQSGLILQTCLIFAISVATAYRLRSAYFAVPALAASVLLPFVVGRWPGNELWSMQIQTWVFIAAAFVIVGISYLWRHRSATVRGFFYASFWVYIVVALLVSFGQQTVLELIASTIGLALVFLVASYVYRQYWIEAVSLLLVIPIATLSINELTTASEWTAVLVVGFCAAVYALLLLTHHVVGQIERRNLATVASVVIGGGLIFSFGTPESVERIVFFLVLFYIVLGLVMRRLVASTVLQGLFTVSYAVYPLLLLLFAGDLGTGWLVAALTITAITYWAGSYLERSPTVMVFGNIAFIAAVATLWYWLKLDEDWFIFGVSWTSAVVFYVASLVYTFYKIDSQRRYIHLIFTWIVLGFATLINFFAVGTFGYAAAGTLLAIAGTIVAEGVFTKRRDIIEMAIYIATLALQRIVTLAVPELTIVLYGHWWALVIVLVALWRKGDAFGLRLVIATAFVTASSGLMALQEGGAYQLLFLIEHIALLVAGALLRTSWALWWGLAASVLAVLYFLRSSLFLSLLFLGLTLLGIVIWRLIRTHQK